MSPAVVVISAQPCDALILCAGTREWLLPFPGWTLPIVTGAADREALRGVGLLVKGEHIMDASLPA